MAGQVNIGGTTAAVQLQGNDDYTVDRTFTFPDQSGELMVVDDDGNTNADNINLGALNGGPLAGFRNQLINSDFRNWYRGADFTLSSDEVYTADRWWTGNTTTRIRRNATNMFAGFRNALEIQGPEGAVIRQPIELSLAGFDDRFTVGRTYTLSFYCDNAGTTVQGTFANTPQTGAGLFDNEAVTAVPGETDRYSYTFTIADTIGSTDTCLNIGIKKSDADPLFITGVQLEPGPVCTPVEIRPPQVELALCQRYFYKHTFAGSNATSKGICYKTSGGTSQAPLVITYPVTMRATPTSDQSNLVVRTSGGAGASPNNKTAYCPARNESMIYLGASDIATNSTGLIDFSGFFTVDAEL